MAIKWSAVKVSEAMDNVESQVKLAESFLTEAKARAKEARQIANLPEYMTDRLIRVISQIERMDNVKSAIESVRDSIPEGAIDAEHHRGRHGSQQSLV
jgi:methyl-accepting chemotaxis protein